MINGPVPGAPLTNAVHVDAPTLELFGVTPNAARRIRVIIYNPCSTGGTASIPATLSYCAADLNCDATIDFFDYLDFVDAFSMQSVAADFNDDGEIDFFDYLDFVDGFSAGCV